MQSSVFISESPRRHLRGRRYCWSWALLVVFLLFVHLQLEHILLYLYSLYRDGWAVPHIKRREVIVVKMFAQCKPPLWRTDDLSLCFQAE